jgi:hypothetical protein
MGRGTTTRVAVAAATLINVTAFGGVEGSAHDDGHDGHHDDVALELVGEAILPTGTLFEGTTVGGLSSITYDADSGAFYALADDQSVIDPARFYTLDIALGDGRLDDGDVSFVDVTTLLAPDGQPYPAASFDPEGLTLTRRGELIVTSEGIATRNIAPWVRRYDVDGTYLGDLDVPAAFDPTGPTHGVRQNLAFEAAAVTPRGNRLFVGMEGALVQDGPAASLTLGSPARILRYQLGSGRLDRQYIYPTDPIAEPPVPPTAFAVNGLVELLPLDQERMIAMERSFSVGAPGTGNTVKLYLVSLERATNVNGAESIADVRRLRPARKMLLLDLRTLGIPLDNIEGMTFGPELPDGRRSLVLVSDNNFAATQFTQFLVFAVG